MVGWLRICCPFIGQWDKNCLTLAQLDIHFSMVGQLDILFYILYVFTAILVHNSALNYIKQKTVRAKEISFSMS